MKTGLLLSNLHGLLETPASVQHLRCFILDLAVRGKLVPQDPNDEPASELLKQIAKEKQRLVKAEEVKQRKPLPPVDEDVDFDVPSSWRWTRLGIVSSYIQRGKSPRYATSDGSPVVSQKSALSIPRRNSSVIVTSPSYGA
jgi:type I restriction enzyme S subunit